MNVFALSVPGCKQPNFYDESAEIDMPYLCQILQLSLSGKISYVFSSPQCINILIPEKLKTVGFVGADRQ